MLHLKWRQPLINDLLDTPKRLKDQGIMLLSLFSKESMDPSVLGWMPAAAT
jgi:hypothetical protein